jgi:hypothetical protein
MVHAYTDERNQVSLEEAIDKLDEAWDVALGHSAQYQQAMRHYNNCIVRERAF